jgi:hypothetical protein
MSNHDDDQPRHPFPHGSPYPRTTPTRPESTALDDHERELGRSGVDQCRQTLSHATPHPPHHRETELTADR